MLEVLVLKVSEREAGPLTRPNPPSAGPPGWDDGLWTTRVGLPDKINFSKT